DLIIPRDVRAALERAASAAEERGVGYTLKQTQPEQRRRLADVEYVGLRRRLRSDVAMRMTLEKGTSLDDVHDVAVQDALQGYVDIDWAGASGNGVEVTSAAAVSVVLDTETTADAAVSVEEGTPAEE